jgi:serine/threonine protein kinase
MNDVSSQQCPRCGCAMADGWCLPCVAKSSSVADAAGLNISSPTRPSEPSIAGFRILKLLGVGGTAQVWLAESCESGVRLAIKVVHDVCRHQPEIVTRFEQEAELLLSMNHPNVLALHDVGETDAGNLYLATPYVDGCDLRTLLKAGRLPQDRAMEIFLDVCKAMEHAHQRSVIHRDLKPANILIGADGAVKVADFGLAKNIQSPSEQFQTRPQDVFGTPYYIAPEAVRDSSQVDARADVYALGVLLYELLTGSLPQGHFTSLASRTGLARGWDGVVQAALKDEPNQRTPTVATLRQAVEKLWLQEKRRSLWRGRRPWMIGATGVAAALILGLWLGRRPPPPPKPIIYPSPTTATIAAPWQNSTGLKFVPVPDHQCLMSTTEVRISDFMVYLEERDALTPPWILSYTLGPSPTLERLSVLGPNHWEATLTATRTDYQETEDVSEPAYGMSLVEAYRYASWLTWKERGTGRIAQTHHYRPPTHDEWTAVGGYVADALGNFAGPEAKDDHWPADRAVGTNTDPFPRQAPTASFPPNQYGIYDLAGNVAEWVTRQAMINRNDVLTPKSFALVVGGSWADLPIASTVRDRVASPAVRSEREDVGMRLVLDLNLSSLIDPETVQPKERKAPRRNRPADAAKKS